jgi:hypothetical protein
LSENDNEQAINYEETQTAMASPDIHFSLVKVKGNITETSELKQTQDKRLVTSNNPSNCPICGTVIVSDETCPNPNCGTNNSSLQTPSDKTSKGIVTTSSG